MHCKVSIYLIRGLFYLSLMTCLSIVLYRKTDCFYFKNIVSPNGLVPQYHRKVCYNTLFHVLQATRISSPGKYVLLYERES